MPGEGRLSSGNRFRGINIDITRRARLSLPVSLTPVVLSIGPIFALHIAPEIQLKTLTKFNIKM